MLERFYKVDGIVENVFKWLSYVSGIASFLIGFLVTLNIITSKLFNWSIPSVNDWVSYMFLLMFCFAISYVRLSQGLVSVDILTKRFPDKLNDAITVFSDIVGFVLYGLIGYYAWPLMLKNLKYHVRRSYTKGSFDLWPFNLVLMIFFSLFALTMIWHIIRLFVYKQHGERPRAWGAKKEEKAEEGIPQPAMESGKEGEQ